MAEDHEARQMAAAARQKIDSHEDRCTERWAEARKSLDDLHRRWWWLLTSIIGAGATIAAGFFALWNDLQATLTTIQITLYTVQQMGAGG